MKYLYYFYPELVNRVSSESHKTCFNGRVASEEKTRSGLISDWLEHGVGISDELQEHGGCRFASAENFTETNVNNVNNSFTNKNNNPTAATSFVQPNGGEAASHDNLFLLVNGRRPLGVLFIFVSVYAFCRMENVTNSLIRDKINRDISSGGIFADNHIL